MSHTAPTAIAEDMHAGAEIEFAEASFPLETKLTVPRSLNILMAELNARVYA